MECTFADEALLDEAPEHVAAMMTVGGLVEGLLAEAVSVRGKEFHGDDRSRHSETVESRQSSVPRLATGAHFTLQLYVTSTIATIVSGCSTPAWDPATRGSIAPATRPPSHNNSLGNDWTAWRRCSSYCCTLPPLPGKRPVPLSHCTQPEPYFGTLRSTSAPYHRPAHSKTRSCVPHTSATTDRRPCTSTELVAPTSATYKQHNTYLHTIINK